jgi:hypothetical protein
LCGWADDLLDGVLLLLLLLATWLLFVGNDERKVIFADDGPELSGGCPGLSNPVQLQTKWPSIDR